LTLSLTACVAKQTYTLDDSDSEAANPIEYGQGRVVAGEQFL
jgi:hypothetical protein